MKMLVSRSAQSVIRDMGEDLYRHHLGLLVTPRSLHSPDIPLALGAPWAADNDCFQILHRERFIAMLHFCARYPGCRWVAAPDIVGNAEMTLHRFRLWAPVIRYFKLPIALVAQDGLERLPVPWLEFETLFIGGSTKWKLGEAAADLALKAQRLGKSVHLGRVNGNRRIRYGQMLGIDTADGSAYARFAKDRLPELVPTLKVIQHPLWEGLKCA